MTTVGGNETLTELVCLATLAVDAKPNVMVELIYSILPGGDTGGGPPHVFCPSQLFCPAREQGVEHRTVSVLRRPCNGSRKRDSRLQIFDMAAVSQTGLAIFALLGY